jgi:hypothetical protein
MNISRSRFIFNNTTPMDQGSTQIGNGTSNKGSSIMKDLKTLGSSLKLFSNRADDFYTMLEETRLEIRT